MIFNVVKDFRAVSVNLVAGELIDIEVPPFSKRKKDSRHDQGLFVLSELSIIAQVFVKSFSASKDLFKFDFLGRLLAQNHASIVSVNVLGCEVLKRIDFG